MSGHNKWSQIKHKKGATDAARSKLFTKFSRLITVESRLAAGDVNSPGLRTAIERARKENMTKDAIDRAVAKGTSAEAGSMEAITYETYGPGGVAVIFTTLTDSRNRTAQEIKHLLTKNGYELAAPGSAAWAFKHENGEYIPTTTVPLSDTDGEKLAELVDILEDNDDVQNVYTNAEMKVIAIDPGFGRCGIAVVERIGATDSLLYSACVETSAKSEFLERLHNVGRACEEAIALYAPEVLAIEKLYFSNNQKTAMQVAEVRGMILSIAARNNLAVSEYTPGTIKLAVTGSGAADKRQIARMIPLLIKITHAIRHDDEYDAIAIGLTHLAYARVEQKFV